MNRKNWLKPLKERLSPAELERRAARTALRTQLSLEHARTRGMVNVALFNTDHLDKVLKRLIIASVIGAIGLIGMMLYLWWKLSAS